MKALDFRVNLCETKLIFAFCLEGFQIHHKINEKMLHAAEQTCRLGCNLLIPTSGIVGKVGENNH